MAKIALLLLMLSAPFHCLGEVLRFYAENLPPYHFLDKDGKPTGALVEVVEAIAREAKVPVDIELLPFARGYSFLLHDRNAFMFSLIRTEEREEKVQWVGKIYQTDAWLVGLKGRKELEIQSMDEAKSLIVGTIRGYHSETFLRSLGFRRDKNMLLSVNYNLMWNMLFRRRSDFVLTNSVSLETELTSLGLSTNAVEKYYQVKHFPGDLYIVTNNKTAKEPIQIIAKALKVVKQSGQYQRIIDKWKM